MIEEDIELLEKEQVGMMIALSTQIQNHLAQGHVFLVSENNVPRISTSAEEIVQLILAGVQVGIGFPKSLEEESVEKKFIYTVEFLVYAEGEDKAGNKLKEKLVSAGLWACEDHMDDNGEPGLNNSEEEFSFELIKGDIF